MRQAPRTDDGVYTREFTEISASRQKPAHVREFDERLTNSLHYDHMMGTLPMLLKFGDALSMASSIESRLPFLDHRLVEFVFQLPTHHKFDGSLSKGILREVMAGIMPEQIRSRKDKVGFYTPMSRWISRCLDSGISPILLSDRCKNRAIFNMKKIESLLSQQARGLAQVEHSIFCWLSVELSFRLFIDGEGISDGPVTTLEAPNPRLDEAVSLQNRASFRSGEIRISD
jgi:asparagine synthetase B (glutamine-hydrolysing)